MEKSKTTMRINYVASWDSNRKTTWSGTTYSLLSALKEKNNVDDINMNSEFNQFLSKINLKIFRYMGIDVFYKYIQMRLKKIALNQSSHQSINIQVHSIVDLPKSYIYEDLIWESLAWIKKIDPDSFEVSGFQTVNDKIFDYRLAQQSRLIGNDKIVLSMSRWLTNFINEKTSHKAVYVGGGINTPSHKIPFESRDNQTFLFVGRDFHRKGGDIVVSAFDKLKKDYPDAKLIIAGPDKNKLPKEIVNVNGVHFVGDVSVDEVGKLMSTSTCFVMPSKFEAYGLVFVEAMANGMPIIARDKYEMPYFVSQGSGLIMKTELSDKLEVDNLLECMTSLLSNRTQYLKKAQDLAPDIIKEYSWSAVSERIINEIEKNYNYK